MSPDEQRKLGVKLAADAGASKTLAIIENPNSTFENILKTAASEVGVDKLVPAILQGDATWAFNALLYVPDLGGHREALIKMAAARHEERVRVSATDLADADVLPKVSWFNLNLVFGVGYACKYTMYWEPTPVPRPPVIQPSAGTPDDGKWKWSPELSLSVNNTWKIPCRDFELPKSPLKEGDTVWMVVDVCAGRRVETPFRFIYDKSSGLIQTIEATGTSLNPTFTRKGHGDFTEA